MHLFSLCSAVRCHKYCVVTVLSPAMNTVAQCLSRIENAAIVVAEICIHWCKGLTGIWGFFLECMSEILVSIASKGHNGVMDLSARLIFRLLPLKIAR